jgi:hypothetical protein
MDEYLFIAQAKLKADLGKSRQRRDEQAAEERWGTAEIPVARSSRTPRSTALSPDLLSVVSTHGLRGWS